MTGAPSSILGRNLDSQVLLHSPGRRQLSLNLPCLAGKCRLLLGVPMGGLYHTYQLHILGVACTTKSSSPLGVQRDGMGGQLTRTLGCEHQRVRIPRPPGTVWVEQDSACWQLPPVSSKLSS